jgi:low affinity Fe/Cu permease
MNWTTINWETIIVSVIAATPATIAAMASFVQSLRTYKAVNGRMDELLALTRRAAGDEATLVEKKAERGRQQEDRDHESHT